MKNFINSHQLKDAVQKRKILEVPKVRQLKHYCGPASLSMVFAYYGLCICQKEIAEEITGMFGLYKKEPISENGLSPQHMIEYAKSKGFWVDYYNHSSIKILIQLIIEDIPPIVTMDHFLSQRINHFSVATGYNLETKVLYYNEPTDLKQSTLTFEFFM